VYPSSTPQYWSSPPGASAPRLADLLFGGAVDGRLATGLAEPHILRPSPSHERRPESRFSAGVLAGVHRSSITWTGNGAAREAKTAIRLRRSARARSCSSGRAPPRLGRDHRGVRRCPALERGCCPTCLAPIGRDAEPAHPSGRSSFASMLAVRGAGASRSARVTRGSSAEAGVARRVSRSTVMSARIRRTFRLERHHS